ncbi:MAG TPA: prolipoprotein diacylglyceryl transferase, partial [Thermoanaerobacterales bacterium]|nr:prolipoprotein diacylglyceryl transferase [Thermoanaerobacterales bacterium]
MLIEHLNPVAFTIGPLKVYWYGIFMAISFLIGVYYFINVGKKYGYKEDELLNVITIVMISAIVGARLMFVLANYPHWFVKDPLQVLKIHEGGLAWHGGLLGGLIAGNIFARKYKIGLARLSDLVVPGLTTGYILVRIGNIFNHEILGRMTEFWFGRWPAQPIASLIGLVLMIRYFRVERTNPPPGYQFWSFIFYHQLLRCIVEETIRENPLFLLGYVNESWGIGFFTLTHVATPFILLLAYYYIRKSKKSHINI